LALLSQEKIKRMRKDPVFFVKSCTALEPYDYQNRFLRDEGDRIIVKKGRQVGASQMVAWSATWYAFVNAETTVLIVSPSQRQSGIIFRKIRKFVRGSKFLRGSVARMTWSEIELTNGSLIVSLPSGDDGDKIRGYTAEVLIADEAAFMKEPVFNAIEDSTIRGGKRVYISTPFGIKNRFYKMWNDPDWSKHHISSTDCPDISDEEIERKRREKTYIEFEQEVMGEFVEAATLYFDPETLKDAVVSKNVYELGMKTENPVKVLACDPARHGNDLGVIIEAWVLGENVLITKIFAWYNKPLTHYIGTIKNLHEKYKYNNIIIDETGLGGGVVDVLVEEITSSRVEGVAMSSKNKMALYTNARSLMEQKMIFIPRHLKFTGELLNQLNNMEFHTTKSGMMSISASSDDFADAFVLAVYGAKRLKGTGYFRGF